MTPNELSEKIESVATKAIEKIINHSVGTQDEIYNKIAVLVRNLDVESNGTIKQTIKNLNALNSIKNVIYKVFRDNQKGFEDFAKVINEITEIQRLYYRAIDSTYKPTKVANAIKIEAINKVYENLSGSAIKDTIANKVKDVLTKNVTTGTLFTDMLSEVKEVVKTTEAGKGIFERYVTQITTDAIFQYSAQVEQLTSSDLGYEWFVYSGAIIETSRDFCEACKKKKYIHISEFSNLLSGDFKEFKDLKGEINPKTELPNGMIAGTNESNLLINRGGYNCGHRFIGVPTDSVPKSLRDKIK